MESEMEALIALRYVKGNNGFERLICPQCGELCDAEFVDIGVGDQRVEPWHCPACLWVENTAADLLRGEPNEA